MDIESTFLMGNTEEKITVEDRISNWNLTSFIMHYFKYLKRKGQNIR